MLKIYSPHFTTQLASGFLGPETPPKRVQLNRPLRISNAELERAMLLYRHQDHLATLLPARLPQLSRRSSLAVALGEPPCAHALLFGDGSFSACLSVEARPLDLGTGALVPYSLLAEALGQAEAAAPDHALIDGQLRALPPGTLLHALQRGPGHLTREMASVIDMRPETFVLPVALVFWRSLTEHHRLHQAREGQRAIDRAHFRLLTSLDARVRTCLVLLACMEDPRVLATLGQLYTHLTPWTRHLMASLASLPGGGQHLMRAALDPQGDAVCHHLGVQGVVLYTLCFPDQGIPLCQQLLHHPDADLSPPVREQLALFGRLSAESLKNVPPPDQARNHAEQMPGVPALMPSGRYRIGLPLADRFPGEAEVGRVQREWARFIERPGNDGPRPQPVVHTAPRQGRNDPCSCGSGRKYKQCCLNSSAASSARSGS